jgi:hypothetical protein
MPGVLFLLFLAVFSSLVLPTVLHAAPLTGYRVSRISLPKATATVARGLNRASTVVGYYTTATATEGSQRSGTKYTSIVFPGAHGYISASGINDKGAHTMFSILRAAPGRMWMELDGINDSGEFVRNCGRPDPAATAASTEPCNHLKGG